jgi:hypothetical protein
MWKRRALTIEIAVTGPAMTSVLAPARHFAAAGRLNFIQMLPN